MLNLILTLSLLIAAPAQAAPAACKVKMIGVALSHPAHGAVWVTDALAKRAYESLGFKPEKKSRELVYGNVCPASDHPAGEAVTYGKSGVTFILAARTPCEKSFAESLGLTTQVIENFGSMDSGGEIPSRSLLVCSDGTRTVSCASGEAKADASLVEACPAHFLEPKAAR